MTAAQTYSTRFAAKRAALKAYGDDSAFKIVPAGDRFAFQAVATDAASLPKSRMLTAPPVIQDGGPGFLRLRKNADAEALRQTVLNDERKLAAIPPSREGAAAPVVDAPKGVSPDAAALAHDLAKASASEKAAAKRAAAAPVAKKLTATDPAMIGDRLSGDAADMTIDAIARFGKGQTAAPSTESLPFFMTTFAVDCLRKALDSGKLADKGKTAAHAALAALGVGIDPKAGPTAGDGAKAESTAPKPGTTARGIFDMLRRPEGATAKEMTDAGFKDVSCVSSAKQYAARFGLGWRSEKEGKFDRVWLTDAPAGADKAA